MKDMSNGPAGPIADAPNGTPRLVLLSQKMQNEVERQRFTTGRLALSDFVSVWLPQVEAMEARIRELEAEREWKPIETAPKDGTWFWGLVDSDALSMRWHPKFQAFVAWWRIMELAEGYTFDDGSTSEEHSPEILEPQAWMPRVELVAEGSPKGVAP